MQNINYFNDFFKNMYEWATPESNMFDLEAGATRGKKNMEKATDMQHRAMSSMQQILKRQAEIIHENTTHVMDCCKKIATLSSPKEILEEQANFAKEAIVGNLRHLHEITDMTTKAQMEIMQCMSDNVSENVKEHCEQVKNRKSKK